MLEKPKSLPRNFELDNEPFMYYEFDSYIANRHFMLNKYFAKNYSRLKLSEKTELSRIIDAVPDDGDCFVRTERLFDGDYLEKKPLLSRLFYCKEKDIYACLREDYVQFFELQMIYGKDPRATFRTHNKMLFIMPMRLPDHYFREGKLIA